MTTKRPITIATTGSSGNVAYSFLMRVVSGDVFGRDQPVSIHLYDIEQAMERLEGVVMELEDCASPYLHEVTATSDLDSAFSGVSWGFLFGSVRREAGMERKDLLLKNGEIFVKQGQAINNGAADDVRVIVIGNPSNTNCLIARRNAPDVPDNRWFGLMALDRNRAKGYLAAAAGVGVSEVRNVCVWGNHSSTQFPDVDNATIGGKPARAALSAGWDDDDFVAKVQNRGAEIISKRGISSAGSAANAVVTTVHDLSAETAADDCTSAAVISRGEYGIPEGLQFGLPLRVTEGSWSVIDGFELTDNARRAIDATTNELVEERDAVAELLPS